VSDRIAVMHEGEISGVLEREDFSELNVLRLAIGQPAEHAEPAHAGAA
jgi:ribose transport system ATP-binding protein